jgi:hypothetical protein
MKLTCNIDRRGRLVRAVPGVLLAALALTWYLSSPSPSWVLRGVQVLLGLVGGFITFEGTAGWCALRALGMKLPL